MLLSVCICLPYLRAKHFSAFMAHSRTILNNSKCRDICVYMYIYIYIYIHIYIHIHIYTQTYIYIYTHIYIHTHIYIYIHTHTHIYIYTHTYTHTHIYIHTHTHTHIYTHTHNLSQIVCVCVYVCVYIYIHIHTHTQFVTNCERSFHVYCTCDKKIQNNLLYNLYTHCTSNKRFYSFEIALTPAALWGHLCTWRDVLFLDIIHWIPYNCKQFILQMGMTLIFTNVTALWKLKRMFYNFFFWLLFIQGVQLTVYVDNAKYYTRYYAVKPK